MAPAVADLRKADYVARRSRFTDLYGLTAYLGKDPANAKHRKAIYMDVYRGRIPHIKRGKSLLFDLTEIDAWLESLRRVSVEEAIENACGVR